MNITRRESTFFGIALVVASIVAVASQPVDAAPVGGKPIRPGAHFGGPQIKEGGDLGWLDGCTLNFVFEDPQGALYIGAAGHCVESFKTDGSENLLRDGSRFGELVFHSPLTYSLDGLGLPEHYDDFSLFAIDPARYDEVDPTVAVIGGPTGVASPSDVGMGHEVLVYGHGIATDPVAELHARRGIVQRMDGETYGAAFYATSGDSGSPVIHAPSGRAIGIVSSYGATHMWAVERDEPQGFIQGPTVEHILGMLSEAGFDLSLVTGDYV